MPLPKPRPLPRIEIEFEDPSLAIFSSKIARATVIRARWRDLTVLLQHRLMQQACVYCLAGRSAHEPSFAFYFYQGECAKPSSRLPDHRYNPALKGVRTVFLLTVDTFDKTDIVYLQARMDALIKASGCGHLIQGVAPTSLPISRAKMRELDIVLGYGLTLLREAGCPWMERD